MIGILIQLALSWLLLWLFERSDLRVLGIVPNGKRLGQLALFLFVTAICCASAFLLKMHFGNQRWVLNPDLSAGLVVNGIWWHTRSVLFEELIFRGALFYLLIRKIGPPKAILVSAAAFGIYHWFSWEVIGNPVQMAAAFLITGIMGLLLGYAFVRTRSLYAPVAIHLGWNLTQGFVFSDGATGTGIFKQAGDAAFRTGSYTIAFLVFVLPLLSALLINYALLRRMRPAGSIPSP